MYRLCRKVFSSLPTLFIIPRTCNLVGVFLRPYGYTIPLSERVRSTEILSPKEFPTSSRSHNFLLKYNRSPVTLCPRRYLISSTVLSLVDSVTVVLTHRRSYLSFIVVFSYTCLRWVKPVFWRGDCTSVMYSFRGGRYNKFSNTPNPSSFFHPL